MRFLVLIPLFSCLLYLAMARNGRTPAPRLGDTEPADPDVAKMQSQVRNPPTARNRRLPATASCVDMAGVAYGPSDAGFETCRRAMAVRDTASERRTENDRVQPAGNVPSAARPGVAVPVPDGQ